MKHGESTLTTARGTSLFSQHWLPSGEPAAILLIVHGLAEHSGRYEHFARFFTEKGFAAIGFDHEGHGRSDGMRCHIDRFSDFTDGVWALFETARRDFPSSPVFLVGHSMGGLIAVRLLLDRQSEFAGCILSGALIEPAVRLSPLQRFAMRLFSRVWPKLRVLQVDASQVSRDPDVVERYRNDPLVFSGKVTARLVGQLFEAMRELRAGFARIEIPMLILHGGCDGLAAPDGSELLHEKINSRHKKLIIYDGLFHEIYNEPEQERVMTDVADWLAERLGQR